MRSRVKRFVYSAAIIASAPNNTLNVDKHGFKIQPKEAVFFGLDTNLNYDMTHKTSIFKLLGFIPLPFIKFTADPDRQIVRKAIHSWLEDNYGFCYKKIIDTEMSIEHCANCRSRFVYCSESLEELLWEGGFTLGYYRDRVGLDILAGYGSTHQDIIDTFTEKQIALNVNLDLYMLFIKYYTKSKFLNYNRDTKESYGAEFYTHTSIFVCGLNENTPEICYIYGPIKIFDELRTSNQAFVDRM